VIDERRGDGLPAECNKVINLLKIFLKMLKKL